MKKHTVFVLIYFLLFATPTAVAQEMNSKEITDYITLHKWFLRRYELPNQYYTVPEDYQGTYMIFLPEGKVIYYKQGQIESDQPRYDWKLLGTNKISITTHDGLQDTYGFKLKDFIGYKIYITQKVDDLDGVTYVWEDRGKALNLPTKKIQPTVKTTLTDKEKEVILNSVVWQTENLQTTRFRNGEMIAEAKTPAEWTNAGEMEQPAWCYYDNNPKNGEKFGKIYNWYALSDPRGLAPIGYRIPTFQEWYAIGNYKHTDAGGILKAPYYWESPNAGATNSSGFSALPGGMRSAEGNFASLGYSGNWWANEGFDVRARFIMVSSATTYLGNGILNKSYGLSIRCVKE